MTSRHAAGNISGIAGLRAVDVGDHAVQVENVDLTGHVGSSHFEYRYKLSQLVRALGAHTGFVDLSLLQDGADQSQPRSHSKWMPTALAGKGRRVGGFRDSAAKAIQKFWKAPQNESDTADANAAAAAAATAERSQMSETSAASADVT